MAKIPKKNISMDVQHLWMKKLFPNFKYVRGMGWYGKLQPTDISPEYKIKIEFSSHSTPKVWVIEPWVDPTIHHYSDGSLCLYYPKDPKDQRWSDNSIIARTIMPWTAAWLLFYEYWLETGIWFNEEAPHDGPKRGN